MNPHLDDLEMLKRDARFGLEVESFLASPVGRYLCQRAEEEVTAALQELKTVDPTDALTVRALQNKVWRGEQIQYWLGEAVTAGRNAQDELIELSQ